MQRLVWLLLTGFMIAGCLSNAAFAQQPLTWQEIRDRFRATNPLLQAARIGIDEYRAQEITANLRPNPFLNASVDQLHPFQSERARHNVGARDDALPVITLSYLFERMNKRGLRRESAQKGTAIAISQVADGERNLLFTLRSAFIQVLQQKAVVELAKENLSFYDRVLQISSERAKAGDIAKIDQDRLELQRAQFESDLQTAQVTLRTAKIQLLTLLNDRTPVEQFDVAGPFDFSDQMLPREDFRRFALETRPDLKAAVQSIEQAQTNVRLAEANASTDPVIGANYGQFADIGQNAAPSYVGVSIGIPLRIFDRNQGERQRTRLDIERTKKLRDNAEALIYSDVDSAYAMLNSTLILLQPYKTKYLAQAVRVRETVTFSYQRGGASLLDFLQAARDYRSVQLGYLTLMGSYFSAAAQLNLAVGREVVQ